MKISSEIENAGSSTPMPWVVQKFGGTSLGHFAPKIVRDVILELSPSAAAPVSGTERGFVDAVAAELSQKVCSVSGIPVITGYFGIHPAGTLLNLFGRGYTDLCAALVATGLNAAQLQIWKEVDGVFTADPRHVPDSRLLYWLTSSELRGLTFYGTEVVHCAAVDVAKDRHLTMSIRNVKDPLGPGTLVTPNVGASNEQLMAITKKSYMAILNIRGPSGMSGFKFQNHILDVLQNWKLAGELVTASECGVSLAIPMPESQLYGADQPADVRLLCAIEALKAHSTAVKVNNRMALLCVVCRLASSTDFALACILRVLSDMRVPVKMVMHGASDTIVGCVIEEKYAQFATQLLHRDLLSAQTTYSPEPGTVVLNLDE
ncbi:hypothetical protein N8T08_007423 [Aspergillus melleus]|uniref:Uncharacterized protein n=1 Tax=Aspergillus melleus TaxID=138277 RepID=A0ACC3AXW8_9EURO|nr:hypothetical protein N8T08_007423 [Aspergillus melleus]